jgi:hypothetical protein
MKVQIANRSLDGVANFRYLGTTLTDKNCMNEEIKNRLNSGMLVTILFGFYHPSCCPGM